MSRKVQATPVTHSENCLLSHLFHRWRCNVLIVCLCIPYGGTHGMPISNKLFWMSCFPSMVIQSCIHNSIRQPAWAHCKVKERESSHSGARLCYVLVIRAKVTRSLMKWKSRHLPLPFGRTREHKCICLDVRSAWCTEEDKKLSYRKCTIGGRGNLYWNQCTSLT